MTGKTLLTIDDLAAAGLATPSDALQAVAARYSIAVTPQIAALIDTGVGDDPIARQFLPDARELETSHGELADPIGDAAHSPVPGIVHRYEDRVLLKLVAVCPIYCRFCFRRESVGRGKGRALAPAQIDAALDYVAARHEIREVILTGGDPLAASARRLRLVARRLAQLPHVTQLRVHTRVPTAAPQLVTRDRLDALNESGKALRVALHVNHPRELSAAAREAIATLRSAGASLLSQTVLLAGVNDDARTLATLMRDVVSLGMTPYYLHHPDRAPGTAHFRVTLDRGCEIYARLQALLGGAGVPRYVLDIPGGFGKIPIAAPHLMRIDEGHWRAVDRFGAKHDYHDE